MNHFTPTRTIARPEPDYHGCYNHMQADRTLEPAPAPGLSEGLLYTALRLLAGSLIFWAIGEAISYFK
ncbi:hypothetical protein [Hymenobacter sp. BT491]|uniref:hypothetical protein n=1 Tax=Hymenobacter sp. BT491 TaxID=2766779 RepID=UPI0016538766|nr:hypothetical protein [Hymenobacter sp. BT491]MBC6988978.1 hypothetical protein [Hymenobacter sp. BT491]